MKKSTKDMIIIGFALFAMFFGAGNLIFPPSLGYAVGTSYPIAILGFLITGVGLPLISIIACANYGGNFKSITDKVGKSFSLIFNIVLMFILGPLVVIPRTAATTFELGVQPSLPSISPFIVIAIYFLINIFFLLRPSSIVDLIGKFLTPALLFILFSIILKGVIFPFSSINPSQVPNVFSHSLIEGYQTMDVLGAIVIASIVINSIKSKGYENKKSVISMTFKAGLISLAGLAIIYGGLTYLGAQTSTIFTEEVGKSAILITIAKSTFGSFGLTALSIAVSLACLTTSIGLTATIAEFFQRESNGKISYKFGVLFISTLSGIIATLGVDNIVKYAAPILDILYPLAMTLIFISFITKYLGSFSIKATTYTTLLTCSISYFASFGSGNASMQALINNLPLSSKGFHWVIPTLIMLIISVFIEKVFLNKTLRK